MEPFCDFFYEFGIEGRKIIRISTGHHQKSPEGGFSYSYLRALSGFNLAARMAG
ncbi:MAG: hypothetical protein K0S20_780 [Patescibacteria group bacterium]|nr:hypothetical protein [Patescibacteria group bacterium]